MRFQPRFVGIALLAVLGLSCRRTPPPPPHIGVDTLLGEMHDLKVLARLPKYGYTTRQASSTDRRSKTPNNADWFANDDFAQFIRQETNEGRREWVMLDEAGPGAVARIWSANPTGTLRVYIDGATTPALVGKMETLLSGKDSRFPPPFGALTARGYTLYFPIPFRQHCKITVDDPNHLYYLVDYRRYTADAPVVSFSQAALVQATTAMQQTVGALQHDYPAGSLRAVQLSTTTTVVDASAEGSAISELVLRTQLAPDALRSTELIARFDGEETIRVPLDVFFGSGKGLNAYHSLPFDVDADGTLRSRWPMPFRHRAELSISGGLPIAADIRVADWRFGDDSLLFHARWHHPEELSTKKPFDWPLITIEGTGRYVGTVLDVDYRVHSWWGEGDEKIYVDGESFPSWFGTGTEDYFGYGWCSTRLFAHPYHAQTHADGPVTDDVLKSDSFGLTSLNRWHVLDDIPFQRQLRFDLEVKDWQEKASVIFDAAAYYYLRPAH